MRLGFCHFLDSSSDLLGLEFLLVISRLHLSKKDVYFDMMNAAGVGIKALFHYFEVHVFVLTHTCSLPHFLMLFGF